MKKSLVCAAALLLLAVPVAHAGTVVVKADLNAVATPPPPPPPAKPEKPMTAAEKKAAAKKAAQEKAQAAKEAKAQAAREAKEAKARKSKNAAIPVDDPRALEIAKEDFVNFARQFLIKSDRLGVDTQGRVSVNQEDGKFVAVRKEIKIDTMRVEVKRPEEGREHTPFVGHLIYEVVMQQSVGPTKEAALNGKFEKKEQTMREIFRYDKKKRSWIE